MFKNINKYLNNLFNKNYLDKWNREHQSYQNGDYLLMRNNHKIEYIIIDDFLYDKIKIKGEWITVELVILGDYINWSLLIRNSKKIKNIKENEETILNNSLSYNYIKENEIYIKHHYKNENYKINYENGYDGLLYNEIKNNVLKFLDVKFKLFDNNYWFDGNLLDIKNDRYLLINFRNLFGINFDRLYLREFSYSFWELPIPGHMINLRHEIRKQRSAIESWKYFEQNYYYFNYSFYLDVNDIKEIKIKKMDIIKKEYENEVKKNILLEQKTIRTKILDEEALIYKNVINQKSEV